MLKAIRDFPYLQLATTIGLVQASRSESNWPFLLVVCLALVAESVVAKIEERKQLKSEIDALKLDLAQLRDTEIADLKGRVSKINLPQTFARR